MVTLNKVRRLFAVMQQLGIYTEPLLNTGYKHELMAEFWYGDKYLSIDISAHPTEPHPLALEVDITGTYKGVHTLNCIEKGWLYS